METREIRSCWSVKTLGFGSGGTIALGESLLIALTPFRQE